MSSEESYESDGGYPSIVVRYRDGVTVLGLVGEYDGALAGGLRSAIAHECARDRGVVVSFAQTEFIDSSIVLELFVGDRKLQANGRRLVLHTNPAMVCDRILALARSRNALLSCEEIEDAVELATRRSSDSPASVPA